MRLFATTVAFLAAAFCAGTAHADCDSFGKPGKLLYQDDFSGTLAQWVTEYRASPKATIKTENGAMLIDVDGGATAWFRHSLPANVLIAYKRKVVIGGGRNDRLSDLNNFWMASDPKNANLFTRGGKFEDYDNLRMYYVGIGGNTNSTTRFRKYEGNGERKLLGEYTDAAHLLAPNREYDVRIAVYHGCTRVQIDGRTWFSHRDPQPLAGGYFGIRTTGSRHIVRDVKIYALE